MLFVMAVVNHQEKTSLVLAFVLKGTEVSNMFLQDFHQMLQKPVMPYKEKL